MPVKRPVGRPALHPCIKKNPKPVGRPPINKDMNVGEKREGSDRSRKNSKPKTPQKAATKREIKQRGKATPKTRSQKQHRDVKRTFDDLKGWLTKNPGVIMEGDLR